MFSILRNKYYSVLRFERSNALRLHTSLTIFWVIRYCDSFKRTIRRKITECLRKGVTLQPGNGLLRTTYQTKEWLYKHGWDGLLHPIPESWLGSFVFLNESNDIYTGSWWRFWNRSAVTEVSNHALRETYSSNQVNESL